MSWQATTIGELCEVIAGQSPEGSFYNDKGDGMPFYQGKKEFGEKYLGEPTTWTSYVTKVAEPGDILMSVRAPVGPVNFTPAQICIGRGLAAIRARNVNKEFLFYALLAKQDQISGRDGAVFPTINKKEIEAIELSVPPLPEQQRIVMKLDAAFGALREAEGHVERNRANARELFESYLNGVFEGKEWEMKRLQDVSLQFGRGKSKHRPRNDERLYGGPYPFIQTGDVRNSDHVITSYSQSYSDFGLAQSKLWPKGTLCITIAANIAETAVLGFDACFPDSVIGVVADPKKCDIHYVEFLLQSFKSILKAQGKGSAQDNINLGTFENQFFPFPDIEQQKKLAKALDGVLEQTRTLETTYQQKLTELAGLKKSLLGAAFRGEL